MTSPKSPATMAAEARRLAVRALDRANEAVSIATHNRSSIDALERRLDDGHVSIMRELETVRELLGDIVKMLVHQAAKVPHDG